MFRCFCVGLFSFSVFSFPSYAATIFVDTLADEIGGDTSSIIALQGNPGGTGISLREAVDATNNTPGADTIRFSVSGEIHLRGQLTLDDATGGTSILGEDKVTLYSDVRSANLLNTYSGFLIRLESSNNIISRLRFQDIEGIAIVIGDGGGEFVLNNRVVGCVIDVSNLYFPPLMFSVPGLEFGLMVWHADGTVIGGPSVADKNTFIDGGHGVILMDAQNTLIEGNDIGFLEGDNTIPGLDTAGVWITSKSANSVFRNNRIATKYLGGSGVLISRATDSTVLTLFLSVIGEITPIDPPLGTILEGNQIGGMVVDEVMFANEIGVNISDADTLSIGGALPNIINGNTVGIGVDGLTTFNCRIEKNSIYNNTTSGIEISDSPLTAPVINSADAGGVTGNAGFQGEVFLYADNGSQGRIFIEQVPSDVNGDFASLADASLYPGMNITATSIDANNDSTEFSAPFPIPGSSEGEGEGEGEGESPYHSADTDGDFIISLHELLRVIQLYNIDGHRCTALDTEDGYLPGRSGGLNLCPPHDSDFNVPPNWRIDLTEILRLIQIYNIQSYTSCPGFGLDGFCT